MNPRGQVAPQVIVTNVATKQTDKGVAPQSPFEESATASVAAARDEIPKGGSIVIGCTKVLQTKANSRARKANYYDKTKL